LLLNYYFTPPLYTFTIAEPDNVLALVTYFGVAIAVSTVVDLAARRTQQAAHASADAAVLATLSGSVLRGEHSVHAILERLRQTYGLSVVSMLERPPDLASPPGRHRDLTEWHVAATAGEPSNMSHDDDGSQDEDEELLVDDDLVLMIGGRTLPAADRQILDAFAAQAAVALRQQRLEETAGQVRPLAEADRMRTALLSAVSHDLRTPLAAAKAAVDSIRSPDVQWSTNDLHELLDIAAESLDKLDKLVANLLDMSRLQAGMLGVVVHPLAIDDVLPGVLSDMGVKATDVQLQVPDDLPEVLADSGLLERVLDNVISNALRYNPPDKNILVTASTLRDVLELRVIDRGPGIPESQREHVFAPFQRLGDRDNHTGVGLGLALARGLAEAMGGSLLPEETPGGGVTMILSLPVAVHDPHSAHVPNKSPHPETTDRARVPNGPR